MLDVYQVQGIVRQAQAEFRYKFEQDYPEIVEYLANEIIEAAKKGLLFTCVHIDIGKFSIFKIEEYLNFKGFYTEIQPGTCVKKVVHDGGNDSKTTVRNDYLFDELKIKWPK